MEEEIQAVDETPVVEETITETTGTEPMPVTSETTGTESTEEE